MQTKEADAQLRPSRVSAPDMTQSLANDAESIYQCWSVRVDCLAMQGEGTCRGQGMFLSYKPRQSQLDALLNLV
jgi:hypothetical protein